MLVKADILIIFDIDGTLIGSYNYNAWARPYLKQLMKFSFENFANVAIWSAAKETWVNWINISILEPILLEINSENDTCYEFLFIYEGSTILYEPLTDMPIKPLSRIWKSTNYKPHNTLIVDDYAPTFQQNVNNAIWIPHLEPINTNDDKHLLYLIKLLKDIIEYYEQEHTVETFNKDEWWINPFYNSAS
jgi:hypothetical protein